MSAQRNFRFQFKIFNNKGGYYEFIFVCCERSCCNTYFVVELIAKSSNN
jgi:hypothetical protein